MSFGSISIANNGNTIFGLGAISQLGRWVEKLGMTCPLVVTDQGIVAAGLIDKLTEQLTDYPDHAVFADTPTNPDEDAVDAASEAYKHHGCDGVIGFGGGSSLDLAKTVGLRVSHDGPLTRFTTNERGVKVISKTPPMIAIPTTAGTGSEVARSAVITFNNGYKRIIASPYLMPDMSLLDPDVTIGLPPYLTAATGMDAITHCIEAILSPVVNPAAEAIGFGGLTAAIGDGMLLAATEDGGNKEARSAMMAASALGGMAFSKGLGAVHAMSHACGKDTALRLHHGTLNAVLLPCVLRRNYDVAGHHYPRLAKAMGLAETTDLASYFEDLNIKLKLPKNLREMGVTDAMVPDLSAHAADDYCAQTNPIILDADEYADMFAEALTA